MSLRNLNSQLKHNLQVYPAHKKNLTIFQNYNQVSSYSRGKVDLPQQFSLKSRLPKIFSQQRKKDINISGTLSINISNNSSASQTTTLSPLQRKKNNLDLIKLQKVKNKNKMKNVKQKINCKKLQKQLYKRNIIQNLKTEPIIKQKKNIFTNNMLNNIKSSIAIERKNMASFFDELEMNKVRERQSTKLRSKRRVLNKESEDIQTKDINLKASSIRLSQNNERIKIN